MASSPLQKPSACTIRHRSGDGRHRTAVYALLQPFFGIATRKLEWFGIAIGLAGIVMLNSGGNLSGNPWGALLILIGSLSWAFGSVYGSRIELPTGMMAGAIEMLAAGMVLSAASWFSGEKLAQMPSGLEYLPLRIWPFLARLSPSTPICI